LKGTPFVFDTFFLKASISDVDPNLRRLSPLPSGEDSALASRNALVVKINPIKETYELDMRYEGI
jgi:hypothetical protein